MPYIPGSPIDAYCSKCQKDTTHVVIEVTGTQVRSVRCDVCDEEGPMKAAREKTKAALLEYATKRKSVPPAPPKTRRKSKDPRDIFAGLMQDKDLNETQKYNIKLQLIPGDVIEHPTFGLGVVTAITDQFKAKVFFADGERVMICNRT